MLETENHNIMLNHKYILAISLLLTANLVQAEVTAPSFNCKKATTSVEKTICANDTLARLDRKLGEIWKSFIDASNNAPLNPVYARIRPYGSNCAINVKTMSIVFQTLTSNVSPYWAQIKNYLCLPGNTKKRILA